MLCSLIITYIDPGDYGLLLPPKHTRGRKRISCLTGVIFTDRSKSTTPQGDGNKKRGLLMRENRHFYLSHVVQYSSLQTEENQESKTI